MVADAGTDSCLRQPPLLNVRHQGWLGGSQLCLELDIDLMVYTSMDALQALSNGLELLCCFIVVDGVMDSCTLGLSCLAVWRERLDLQDLRLRVVPPDLRAGFMVSLGVCSDEACRAGTPTGCDDGLQWCAAPCTSQADSTHFFAGLGLRVSHRLQTGSVLTSRRSSSTTASGIAVRRAFRCPGSA